MEWNTRSRRTFAVSGRFCCTRAKSSSGPRRRHWRWKLMSEQNEGPLRDEGRETQAWQPNFRLLFREHFEGMTQVEMQPMDPRASWPPSFPTIPMLLPGLETQQEASESSERKA